MSVPGYQMETESSDERFFDCPLHGMVRDLSHGLPSIDEWYPASQDQPHRRADCRWYPCVQHLENSEPAWMSERLLYQLAPDVSDLASLASDSSPSNSIGTGDDTDDEPSTPLLVRSSSSVCCPEPYTSPVHTKQTAGQRTEKDSRDELRCQVGKQESGLEHYLGWRYEDRVQTAGNEKKSGLQYPKIEVMAGFTLVGNILMERSYIKAMDNGQLGEWQRLMNDIIKHGRNHNLTWLTGRHDINCKPDDDYRCTLHRDPNWSKCRREQVRKNFEENRDQHQRPAAACAAGRPGIEFGGGRM